MKKVYFFLVIIIVAFATGFVDVRSGYPLHVGSFSQFLANTEGVEVEQFPTSLSFVGDVLLARRVETYLTTYGSQYVYMDLPKVSSSTVLIGNFEAAIPKEHTQTPDLTFSFSVDVLHIPALREYGFQYMSLANNHSVDTGVADFIHTQEVLEDNGITSFGSPLALSTTSIAYVELDGQTVALVGVYAVHTSPAKSEIQTVFEYAALRSDMQIAYVHWGVEYEPIHSRAQEQLAHMMVNAGADAVLGHHPHVVQNIELYNGVPIFYSLGNFIFDQYFSREVQEGLWVTLSLEGNSVVYSLRGVTSVGSRSVPRVMSAYENDLFLAELANRSTKSLVTQIQNGIIAQ